MNKGICIETDGTEFIFCVTDKGYNDGGYFWTDAELKVKNWCVNYCTSSSFLEFEEIKEINRKLIKLLDNNLDEIETLEFIEPDLQIVLRPAHDIRESGKYSYVKPGYEIEDIRADFLLFPLIDGAFTDQYYCMPLYREEIKAFTNYLTDVISKLE